MRKKIVAFVRFLVILFVGSLVLMVFPGQTNALCGDNSSRTGPKLGNRTDFLYGGAYSDDFIRTKYNDHNGSCPDNHITVTVLLSFDQVANRDQSVINILNRMYDQNMYPIIRLFSGYTGSGFTAITEAEAEAAAKGFSNLVAGSKWNTNQIIVYPGNEINSDAEWPIPATGISMADQRARVASFAKVFAAFSSNAGTRYRVYLPPLNAYLGVCEVSDWGYSELYGHFVDQVRSNGGKIDGAAFTVYNSSPDNITRDIQSMADVAASKGVNSYIISEVGPKLGASGGCRLLDREDDVDQWKSRMSEVFRRVDDQGFSNVFLSAERATTSFFLNCNNQLTTFLVVIGEDGNVSIEEESKIRCDLTTQPTGNRPLDQGFWPNRYPCGATTDDEFHPLRPYPASACEPRIPQSIPEAPFLVEERPSGSDNKVRAHRYINYACGTSIDFTATESFNPFGYSSSPAIGQSPQGSVSTATGGTYLHTVCEPEAYVCRPGETCPTLTCYRTLRYEVETNFRDSNLGFLGNTQTTYPDEELVNNYLSWYFAGVPQVGDHVPLEAYHPDDEYKLVNFSGPLRKLLPFDAQNTVRSVIASAYPHEDNEYADVHNYIVGCYQDIDWSYILSVAEEYLKVVFGNLIDILRFFGILWDAANSVQDGFVRLGSLLVEIGSNPELLRPENRASLISLLINRGFEMLANNTQFIGDLYLLGGESMRRIGALISAVKTDVAVPCETSDNIERLSFFENKPYPEGHLPPNPHDPRYENFNEFWDDYNNWRGLANVFFFGPTNIPFPYYLQDTWAQLFPNIPLSGLEDIAGEGFFTGYGQGVGPYGTNGGTTAPPQFNIIEAEAAR